MYALRDANNHVVGVTDLADKTLAQMCADEYDASGIRLETGTRNGWRKKKKRNLK
jgi:hypothetical protein